MELRRHDLAKEPPSRELLAKLIDDFGVDGVLNRRSQSYKKRGLDRKTPNREEAIRLILEDPNLLRRPLVLQGKKVVLGWDPDAYETLE